MSKKKKKKKNTQKKTQNKESQKQAKKKAGNKVKNQAEQNIEKKEAQQNPAEEIIQEEQPNPAEKKLQEELCGQLDEQIGLCLGHSNQLNALEWHTCNEFNIAVRELVLLLAKRSDMDENNRLDANKIKAFYLAQGEMVEVFSDTLHFCPCEVTKNGFSCIVGLQRGTNHPLEDRKQGLLWAKNKWLLAHEANTSLVQRGGYPGIYGENWVIHPVEG
jgi:hypothetical protein